MMAVLSVKLLRTRQEKELQEEGQNVDLGLFSFLLMMVLDAPRTEDVVVPHMVLGASSRSCPRDTIASE